MDSSVMSLPKPNYTLLIQIYTQHNNSKPVCNCNNCLAIRASPRASQLCCLLRTSPRQRTRVISLSGVVFRLRCGAWYSRYLATGSPRNRCLKTTHNASTHDDNDSCPDNYQPDPSRQAHSGSFPYTKLMNSMLFVNQSASWGRRHRRRRRNRLHRCHRHDRHRMLLRQRAPDPRPRW